MFELIAKEHRRVPHGDSIPMMISMGLHSVIVVLVIITSVLFVASPVPRFHGISAFVAAAPPPPPPPPPAPPQKAQTRDQEPQVASRDATPVEMPPTIEAEVIDSGNRVEFDTPGVVLGGLFDSPAPPPPPPPPPPPAPSAPPAPVRIGGAVGPPKLLTRVEPVYPQIAVEARVGGLVVLETVVDREGRVEDVRVLRSIPLLDRAAMDAVKQWRYAPVLVNGHPVSFVLTVTLTFVLREG